PCHGARRRWSPARVAALSYLRAVRELLQAERSPAESARARRGGYVAPRSLRMGSCAWRYNVAQKAPDRHDPALLHSRYMISYTSCCIFARSLLLGLLVRAHQLSGAEHVALHRGLQVGLGRA